MATIIVALTLILAIQWRHLKIIPTFQKIAQLPDHRQLRALEGKSRNNIFFLKTYLVKNVFPSKILYNFLYF